MSDKNQDLASRVSHLESWVEVVMRTLATLGLEGLLIELDEARAADYSDEYPIPDPRTVGCPRTVIRAG